MRVKKADGTFVEIGEPGDQIYTWDAPGGDNGTGAFWRRRRLRRRGTRSSLSRLPRWRSRPRCCCTCTPTLIPPTRLPPT